MSNPRQSNAKSLAELKDKEKRFEGVIAKEEMPELVCKALKIK